MTAPALSWGEADGQLVVAVVHEGTVAPRLFPARIAARALGALDREAALERDAVGQQEAELRRRDQQLALARQRPDRPLVVIGRYRQDDAEIGSASCREHGC